MWCGAYVDSDARASKPQVKRLLGGLAGTIVAGLFLRQLGLAYVPVYHLVPKYAMLFLISTHPAATSAIRYARVYRWRRAAMYSK
jgi:hypothetical protein